MFRHIPVLSEISLQLIFTPAPHSGVCWQTWNNELCTLNCHSELQTILFAQHKQWSGTHVRCQELFKWSKFWYLNEIINSAHIVQLFCTHYYLTLVMMILTSTCAHVKILINTHWTHALDMAHAFKEHFNLSEAAA